MTLNIGGGFSFARCASSRVSSFCCAMPPLTRPVPPENLTNRAFAQFLGSWYAMWGVAAMRGKHRAVRISPAFSRPCARATANTAGVDDTPGPRVKGGLCLDSGCLFHHGVCHRGAGVGDFRHGPG